MDGHYDLSCSLYGHESDVRGLAPLYQPNGAFVSVSRDMTSRIWVQNENEVTYKEGLMLRGHENFVSCVCVLPPCADHPQGIILTGSNDCNIFAYSINSPSPIYKLTGHTKAVCALAAGKFGMFVSGSWDHTAILWNKQSHIMTLSGHEASVWCVAVLPGGKQILTGSADKTLRLWSNGNVEQIFKGHTDSVRGIAVTDPNHFLSCSNDATILLWHLSGNCLQTFTGHSSYIYSLACLGPNLEFASCGEDRSVKIWKEGCCIQTIAHPTQSVWCVCALPNGDIVTGASDGVVRIFTQDSHRVAEPQILSEFEESVARISIPVQIGDIKTDDLPGPDALHIPGKKEGQTLMIRRKSSIEVYQWNEFKGEWKKIGDVVGGESSDGKGVVFEGKTYDFVFDVSLSEGHPMLKLPYNLNEDPYMAAHKFLEKNDLDPLFLDQVANFIQQQTGTAKAGDIGESFVDPYTGSSRYVVSNNSKAHFSPPTGPKADGKYGYFPENEFIKFEQINNAGVISKLREFNGKVEPGVSLDEDEFHKINSVLMNEFKHPNETCQIIFKMLDWPPEMVFPVLDILRYAMLDSQHCDMMMTLIEPSGLLRLFYTFMAQHDHMKNQFVTLRAICNMFHHSSGRKIVLENASSLIDNVIKIRLCPDKNLQMTVSSFFLNLSVLSQKLANDSLKSSILSGINEFIDFIKHEEAFFRCIVAIGTIITVDEMYVAICKSIGLDVNLKKNIFVQQANLEKVQNASALLLSLLG